MTDHTVLDNLCAHSRIQQDYFDIWGNRHLTPYSTKLALLQAMGVDFTEDTSAAALHQLQEQAWLSIAPPVKVVFENDAAFRIPLTLQTPQLQIVTWRLQLENGEYQSGRCSAITAGETRNIDGKTHHRYEVELGIAPPLGYHELQLWADPAGAEALVTTRLIVCPRQCYQPAALTNNGKLWGLTVQLYALRSKRNWGIGDFTDLKTLISIAAEAGAGLIGINPLHALFLDQPEQASPYSPSNRSALNILYLDIEAIADFSESVTAQTLVNEKSFQLLLQGLRDTERVDYTGVAAAKLEILRMLYHHFRTQHIELDTARAQAFHAFLSGAGEALHLHAIFDALQSHFHAQDPAIWGWPQWPEVYRDPQSTAVAAFCREQHEQVEFFAYLQWQAELQLSGVGDHCHEVGMPIGLYQDLAIGPSSGGAETWMNPTLYAKHIHVGAPPDEFNLNGQDWGLPPMIPDHLIAAGYAPYIAMLRAVMRHAGALRIDHVMGLMRLFWVPANTSAAEGAYVGYPLWDLMGILALESQRQRCLIIGEDLGTVPDDVRTAMSSFDVLSYRLLYFERTHGDEFAPAEYYPARALVTVATHDLPTLRGFWTGTDLVLREKLKLYPSEEIQSRQAAQRKLDRERLLRALERNGLLTQEMRAHGTAAHDLPPMLAQALNVYLGRSPARLLAVQPEDIFEQINQVNVPSTVEHQYPNWRYKITLNLENWQEDPRLQGLSGALRELRGSWKH